MAYTLAETRTLVRQRADMEGSTFVTDAELDNYIADSARELYDLLISVYGEDYHVLTQDVSTAAGVDYIDISGLEIYRILRVDALLDSRRRPMRRWQLAEQALDEEARPWSFGVDVRYRVRLMSEYDGTQRIHFHPVPAAVYSVRIYYRPFPPYVQTEGEGSLDAPYPEYVIIDAAIKCAIKEESDISPLMAQKQSIIERIQRDAPPLLEGEPHYIVDAHAFADADLAFLDGRY